MLLAVDTSTRYAGVALGADIRVVASRSWYSGVNHTVELMPAIAQILRDHGIGVNDLDGVAIALGPGGFSSLRVGMGVVKGLALTSGKPVAAVGTLDLEAMPYLESGLPVCALLEAGRSEFASANFGPDGERTRVDMVCPIEELLESITELTLFCGEGVLSSRELIREHLGPMGAVALPTPSSRLGALCQLGWKSLAEGDVADLASLQPTYLRMPSVGGPKRRDWTPQKS